MKKYINQIFSFHSFFPKANTGNEPQVLKKVIKDLAPEVLSNSGLMLKIRQYIFKEREKVPRLESDHQEVLRKELSTFLQGERQQIVDDLILIIEGFRYLKNYYQFKTNDEIDAYMENNCEKMNHRIEEIINSKNKNITEQSSNNEQLSAT